MLSDKFDFLTIEITKQEIEEHRQELLDKTRLTDEQLNLALSLLFSRIFVVSDIVVESKMDQAKKIMDTLDPDDAPLSLLRWPWRTTASGAMTSISDSKTE